jgi:hypothetical protein
MHTTLRALLLALAMAPMPAMASLISDVAEVLNRDKTGTSRSQENSKGSQTPVFLVSASPRFAEGKGLPSRAALSHSSSSGCRNKSYRTNRL